MGDNRLVEAFGRAVRKGRERKGWSQDRLAAEASLHRTYIGSVERGERNVTLASVLRIAKALGVTGAALFAEAEADL